MKKTASSIAHRKFTLHQETLRYLSSGDLGHAAGGSGTTVGCTDGTCAATCVGCTTRPPSHKID